jgi:hypothetical protein
VQALLPLAEVVRDLARAVADHLGPSVVEVQVVRRDVPVPEAVVVAGERELPALLGDPKLLAQLVLGRDVPAEPDDAQRLPRGRALQEAARLDVAHGPVRPNDPEAVPVVVRAPRQDLQRGLPGGDLVVRVHRVQQVLLAAADVLAPQAVDLEHAVVPRDAARLAVLLPHAETRRAEGELKALGERDERPLRLAHVRDVAVDADHPKAPPVAVAVGEAVGLDVADGARGRDDPEGAVDVLPGPHGASGAPPPCSRGPPDAPATASLGPAVELLRREAVDRALPLVPDDAVGGRVEVPDAGGGGLQGELQPLAALLELERALGHLELEVGRLLLHPRQKLVAGHLDLVAVPFNGVHPPQEDDDEAEERHGVRRGEVDGLVVDLLAEALKSHHAWSANRDGGTSSPITSSFQAIDTIGLPRPKSDGDRRIQAGERERAAEDEEREGAGRRHLRRSPLRTPAGTSAERAARCSRRTGPARRAGRTPTFSAAQPEHAKVARRRNGSVVFGKKLYLPSGDCRYRGAPIRPLSTGLAAVFT